MKNLVIFLLYLNLTSSEMLEVQTQTAVDDFPLNKIVKSITIHSISETNIAIIYENMSEHTLQTKPQEADLHL